MIKGVCFHVEQYCRLHFLMTPHHSFERLQNLPGIMNCKQVSFGGDLKLFKGSSCSSLSGVLPSLLLSVSEVVGLTLLLYIYITNYCYIFILLTILLIFNLIYILLFTCVCVCVCVHVCTVCLILLCPLN